MTKAPKAKAIENTDERSAKETERIAAKTLKNILNTPPKPHKEMVGSGKRPSKASRSSEGKK
jgi:hypothetical protein